MARGQKAGPAKPRIVGMQATADVPSAPDPSSVRARALTALCLTDPQAKIDATHTLQADSLNAALACRVDPGGSEQLGSLPGDQPAEAGHVRVGVNQGPLVEIQWLVGVDQPVLG